MNFAYQGSLTCLKRNWECTDMYLCKYKGIGSLKHVVGPRYNSWINAYEKDIVGMGPAFGI